MITKIISGGQIGADQAGLRVGRALGIPTGGWAPKDFMTLGGPDPDLKIAYGLIELSEPGYKPRTFANVYNADATVRFAFNFNSPGECCTLSALNKYGRPYFDVNITLHEEYAQLLPNPVQFAYWLNELEVETLNVAGNASRDIEEFVCQYLATAIGVLKHLDKGEPTGYEED